MTKHEAQVAHVSSTLCLNAIKSNQYAQSYPSKAAKAVEAAEAYAEWLNANGHTALLEIVEENGQRKVLACTLDGKTWVKNGAFVNDPAKRE